MGYIKIFLEKISGAFFKDLLKIALTFSERFGKGYIIGESSALELAMAALEHPDGLEPSSSCLSSPWSFSWIDDVSRIDRRVVVILDYPI